VSSIVDVRGLRQAFHDQIAKHRVALAKHGQACKTAWELIVVNVTQ
jgi:hypothetical protein